MMNRSLRESRSVGSRESERQLGGVWEPERRFHKLRMCLS